MILVPNFPYTVHDEPTDDWTVEQLIHWYLLRSQAKTQETRDELMESLQRQFEEGKMEIVTLCQKAVETRNRESTEGNNENNDSSNIMTNHNDTKTTSHNPLQPIDPNIYNNNNNNNNSSKEEEVMENNCGGAELLVVEKKEKTKSSNRGAVVKSVSVEISAGLYKGQSYVLRPRPRHPCFVGRSAGKKFQEKGISMPDDPEVSTTHGKFEMKSRKIYFTDMGSTNGTLHEGVDMEPNTPLEVHDGMELLIGGLTNFKLTLNYT